MKHIKTFENRKEIKYDYGDYVLLKNQDHRWRIELICKITDVYINGEKRSYGVLSYEIDRPNIISSAWVQWFEIERKLTEEEIEEYKISKMSKKYNL